MQPDFKSLKKLAQFCRKAGIQSYKCAEFEFTLADYVPESNYKKRIKRSTPKVESSDLMVDSDSLSEDELLFWSATSLDTKVAT